MGDPVMVSGVAGCRRSCAAAEPQTRQIDRLQLKPHI